MVRARTKHKAGGHKSKAVDAINDLIEACESDTALIRAKWRENYDMFAYGTQSVDKQDWQTSFSVNKLSTATRTAQGRLVNILVNTPDWYEIEARGNRSPNADVLAPAFKKLLDYYLDSSKFKRHASTFFLCSLISTGSQFIGWKKRMIPNPAYISEKTEKERSQLAARTAKNVVNPEPVGDVSTDLSDQLTKALEEFQAMAVGGEAPPEEKTPPYIEVGCLDIRDINHEHIYWDSNVMYMEDSQWVAFKFKVNKWELDLWARLGFFKASDIEDIGSSQSLYAKDALENVRYKRTTPGIRKRRPKESELIELTVYSGPLIVEGKIKKDRYYAIIANGSTLLRGSEYPFWEPPGHHTPVITSAVRQVPYRATGAGIGDNAVALQKVYDSNWQLLCDTFRVGIGGINVVNYQSLVDKGQLAEGVYPGMTLQVRGNPRENFTHIDMLSKNIESQASPVQRMLEASIEELTGINDLMIGGNNPYSRTSAAETEARMGAGAEAVNTIALDLETNFLLPALQKCFARVLQFGLPELQRNPELQNLFNEEELQALSQLDTTNRVEILNQWYQFKVNGFTNKSDDAEQVRLDNEILQLVSGNPLLAQLINLPEFLKRTFKNRNIKEPDKLLIPSNSPYHIVSQENSLLMSGHMVLPSQNDDHEFHLQMQMQLAQSPYATNEVKQHAMMHQQALQQMQMMQQQQQQQGPNGQGQQEAPEGYN